MKEFPGALTEDKIDHDSDAFKLIQERNAYLWKFVRAVIPGASGRLHDYVDLALMRLSDPLEQADGPDIQIKDGDAWLIFPDAAISIEGICRFGAPGPIVKKNLRAWRDKTLAAEEEA